jgi:hypothetical protein
MDCPCGTELPPHEPKICASTHGMRMQRYYQYMRKLPTDTCYATGRMIDRTVTIRGNWSIYTNYMLTYLMPFPSGKPHELHCICCAGRINCDGPYSRFVFDIGDVRANIHDECSEFVARNGGLCLKHFRVLRLCSAVRKKYILQVGLCLTRLCNNRNVRGLILRMVAIEHSCTDQ